MIKCILRYGLFLLLIIQMPVSAELIWKVEGLAQPESALFDEERNRLIVSNINGHPTEVDGNGYLSLVSLDGELINLHWVDKLDAPKGMALVGDQLLVADLSKVHVIDVISGKLIQSIAVPGAVLLNDISSHDGRAWISDLLGNSIYLFENGTVTEWLTGNILYHPNGVLVDGDTLIVSTWGDGLRDDFTTEVPGGLLSINIATKKITSVPAAEKIGNLDGVVKINDLFIVNDWITGTVYKVSPGKDTVKIEETTPGLGDIAIVKGMILYPFMNQSSLEARRFIHE